MRILLTGWRSGMEYYGASRTGLGSLEHELGHMYFGVSTVNRTWRDTWLDESAVVWWEERRSLRPVRPAFRSSIGTGRASAAPGFDESAYGAGARVLEAIARSMGGDEEMIAFLADLHTRRKFEPFTTAEFLDDVLAAQDSIDRDRIERWLLSGSQGELAA
jgi:aminopeptidase N